jgi:hypothetical protein
VGWVGLGYVTLLYAGYGQIRLGYLGGVTLVHIMIG